MDAGPDADSGDAPRGDRRPTRVERSLTQVSDEVSREAGTGDRCLGVIVPPGQFRAPVIAPTGFP
jgi:hypothetical protein